MRHKGYKNRGGTTDGALALDLRPGSRIGRNHWHSRKRIQMIMVPKRHDWDSLMLQGAAVREVQERGIKTVSKGRLFRKMNGIKEESAPNA